MTENVERLHERMVEQERELRSLRASVKGSLEVRESLKRERAERQRLERELRPLREAALRRREEEASLSAAVARASSVRWEVGRAPPRRGPGTPFLFLSDLHMNEEVVAAQIQGFNSFSPDIAKARLEEAFRTAVDLAKNHMVRPEYEHGVYLPVGGDVVDTLQGRVHEGERLSRPRMQDAVALAVNALLPGYQLLREAFGGVVSPWVSGNHDRLGRPMPFHDRGATSLAYGIFRELVGLLTGKVMPEENEGHPVSGNGYELMFAPGPRLVFTVYPGTPAEHRYLLLHGDPASGMPNAGNGYAGFLPTIGAGVRRLRGEQAELGAPFDTALIGHFHTYMVLPGAIVNGSLPGYTEYAHGKALSVDPPRQAFWFHHPKYGITCSWPVYVGKSEEKRS